MTVNVAKVWPWATVTVAGTVAAEVFELDNDTVTPPLPAAEVNDTVPVAEPPLIRVPELAESVLSAGAGGLIVTP